MAIPSPPPSTSWAKTLNAIPAKRWHDATSHAVSLENLQLPRLERICRDQASGRIQSAILLW